MKRRALTDTEARIAKKLAEKDLDLKRELARTERNLIELQAICSHAKRTNSREPCPDCGEQSLGASWDAFDEPTQLSPTALPEARME